MNFHFRVFEILASVRMTSFEEKQQAGPELSLQSTSAKDVTQTKDLLDLEKGTDTTVNSDDEDELVKSFIPTFQNAC